MCTYITIPVERGRQITFEDVLFDRARFIVPYKTSYTATFIVNQDATLDKYRRRVGIPGLIKALEKFCNQNAALYEVDRHSLYHTFYIPKRTGGYRKIDEPLPELMNTLRTLKTTFESHFNVLHHTSAYAYVRGRCAVDAVKKHQTNKSRWFLKTDFKDFFGSTSPDYVWRMLSQIFPFSDVVADAAGAKALKKALDLCFLDGGLPQGTPISPLLTNIVNLPLDHALCNALVKDGYVYTRYADDILISHRQSFDAQRMCQFIEDTLRSFDAPFRIKPEKTRYGSSAGKNWNLGVMLNASNQITIGRKNKEYLKAACNNYLRDKQSGVRWAPHDVMVLRGKLSYYKMVEQDYIDGFIRWFNQKRGVNLMRMLRDELK